MYGSLKATVFVVAAARAFLLFCCFVAERAVEILWTDAFAVFLDITVFLFVAERFTLETVFFTDLEVAVLEDFVSVFFTTDFFAVAV